MSRIVSLIIVLLLGLNSPLFGDVFKVPTENGKVVTSQRDFNPKPPEMRSMVSRKNLLGLDRDTPFGLPKSKKGQPLGLGVRGDSLHILALKVDFQLEDPDDPTTTGNGNMDMRTYEEFLDQEGHEFDPAPHNSAYFSSHLQALNRYWRNVSDHNLELTWDIYPQDDEATYRLPHQMAYYGSEGPWADSGVVTQLLNFMKDAMRLADQTSPEINFADYDSYFIFHAGADQQTNFAFIEDTPNDFFTGFIWTSDTSIVVDGSLQIHEVMLMPETQSQDNRITVLNAVMAHEFGHQLGLIDLYNTTNFLTTVGDFSLMDNNGASNVIEIGQNGSLVSGLIPTFPDAWSRAYLGFSGVMEVSNGTGVEISAAEQLHFDNEIVKVPISDYEYFLIENRRDYADFRWSIYSENDTLYIDADPETGVVMGPVYGYYLGDDLVKLESFEYDVLLPGDGLLIWHVDEAVAYMDYTGSGLNNFIWNTLQWDPTRRFVSLVEADGIVDFGGNYVSFNYYGTDDDFFKLGNNTDLTPSTRPDSRSNLGANSFISITDISESDTIMTCNISTGWNYEGFPAMAFPDLNAGDAGMIAADLNNDGMKELIAARNDLLLGFNSDASFVIDTSYGLILPDFAGDTLLYLIPRFAVLDTMVNGRLAAGDFDNDDTLEVVCTDAAGKIYIFEAYDIAPDDDLADLTAELESNLTIASDMVVYDLNNDGYDDILFGAANGRVYLLTLASGSPEIAGTADALSGPVIDIAIGDSMIYFVTENEENFNLYIGSFANGGITISNMIVSILGTEYGGLAVGDINRDDNEDIVITAGDKLVVYDNENIKTVRIENPSAPSLGDINADGYPDIAVVSLTDNVTACVYHHNGVLLDGFPTVIDLGVATGSRVYQPLITDFDDDDSPDIIISYILNKPLLLDFDRDGTNDIVSDQHVGGLTCINNHGDLVGGFPIRSGFAVSSEPVISDFDNDGDLDIAMIDSAGFVTAWDTGLETDSLNSPWPMYAGGYENRNFLSPEFLKAVVEQPGFLESNLVYNYPNPASDMTTFRYIVDRPSYINIQIYDMSGELVDELNDLAAGENTPDETDWNCSRYASGVYFARVEAKAVSGEISENTIIKIALLK